MLWTLPELGCAKIPNRTNVEYYGVEANPQHDAALRRRFAEYPDSVGGMFTRTARVRRAEHGGSSADSSGRADGTTRGVAAASPRRRRRAPSP